MNRRDALKTIGVMLGTALTPSLAQAMEAGYATPAAGEPLRAFTPPQSELVATLAELIIPTTDTPGGRAARVDAFIDGLLVDIFPYTERQRFLDGLAGVDARARAETGKAFLSNAPEKRLALLSALEEESRKAPAGSQPFFPWLKELTLVGYYTSEIGASQELKYVNVAGAYDGDIPYAQVGRAYS